MSAIRRKSLNATGIFQVYGPAGKRISKSSGVPEMDIENVLASVNCNSSPRSKGEAKCRGIKGPRNINSVGPISCINPVAGSIHTPRVADRKRGGDGGKDEGEDRDDGEEFFHSGTSLVVAENSLKNLKKYPSP